MSQRGGQDQLGRPEAQDDHHQQAVLAERDEEQEDEAEQAVDQQQQQLPHLQTNPQNQEQHQLDQQQNQQDMATGNGPETTVGPEQVYRMFQMTDENLKELKVNIQRELDLGLKDEEAATIKMLITYVRELAQGNETGSYLALDLGGTHFRVLLVELRAGKPEVTTALHTIPDELLVTREGQELFDYIALKLLEFVQQHRLKRQRISLGFTFSFPCKQYGLTQSVLVKWCKGFDVGGVVGTDVVRQLKAALKRQLAGLVEAYVDVVAVINDTTGTLVACANSEPDCRIGLIVGTGFNACYMESLDRCDKWPANYTNPRQVIINCEWGAMGDHPSRRELDKLRNQFDHQVDAGSINPRSQTYEKMVSGMYIGELLRFALIKLHQQKLIFARSPNCGRLNVKNCMNGKHLSMLAKDELAKSTDQATKIVQELKIANYTRGDLEIMIHVASCVINRSADLVAAGVSTLLERLRRPRTVIGYDGSVIKCHPYFLSRLVRTCEQLTAKEFKFEFVVSSDGSGIGAAVVAAALHKERRPIYVVKPGKLYELHYINTSVSRSSEAAGVTTLKSDRSLM